ncbi:MAG: glycosyltransferase family 1 protein [Burkholderiales bacterium]
MSASPPGMRVDNYPAAQRSLRIAFVTETYPPEVNGVAMSTARLVEGLHRRNHDVQLIRPRQEGGEPAKSSGMATPRFHEVLTRGLPIPQYPDLRMGLASKRSLVRLWSLHRPDVVHLATEGPLSWSALQAARHLKLPVSSDFRTNFHAYSKHYGIGWLQRPVMAYLRKFHNRAHCTLVPTEALRTELAERGFQRLAVVSRGVDTQLFTPERRSQALRARWGVGPDDLLLACVGRLAPEKNLGVLIDAFEAVRRQHPNARLLLVGDGPQRDELQARCPQAVFAGQRSGDDLAAHYASADLFAFPSLTETFGNVTTEAMASGLPVLAFNHAAAGQLIQPGRNGQLVPPGDTASFVRTAVAMAGDIGTCRAMGLQARTDAEQLGWDSVVARFQTVLVELSELATQPPAPAARGRPADALSRA